MIKPFELFQKVLMVLAFWSVVLLCIHLKDMNGSWKMMLLDYCTDILKTTSIVGFIYFIFFLMYRNDEKIKRGRFKPAEVDGFDINIGNYLRQTPLVINPEPCLALDRVHEYFIPMETLVRTKAKSHSKSEEELNKELIESQEQEKNVKSLVEVSEIIALKNKIETLSTQISDAIEAKHKIEESKSGEKKLSDEKITELKLQVLSQEEIEDVQAIIKSYRKEISTLEGQKQDDGTMSYQGVAKVDPKTLDADLTSTLSRSGIHYKGLLYYRDIFEQLWNTIPNKTNADGQNPRMQCQEYLTRILEAVPDFKYEGVVSSTPKINKIADFDINVKDYQLTIFTALFPYLTWLQIREHASVLKMDLRDKRLLFTARRLYDIYQFRDVDLKKGVPSSHTIPLKQHGNGWRVTHEESTAMVELARLASSEQAIVVDEPTEKRKANTNLVTEQEMIKLISDLLLQEDRLNGSNRDKRIGMLAGGMLYLNWSDFIMQVKVEFMRSYPQHAKNLKTMEYVVFDLFRRRDFLGMEIANRENPLEAPKIYMDGQLFKVRWIGAKASDTEIVTEGILVVRARRSFKPLNSTQSIKKASGIPQIIGLDDESCVANSEYAKHLHELQKANRLKKKEEEAKAKALNEANKEIQEESSATANDSTEVVKSSVTEDSLAESLLASAKEMTPESIKAMSAVEPSKDEKEKAEPVAKANKTKPQSKNNNDSDKGSGSGSGKNLEDTVIGQAVEDDTPTKQEPSSDNLSLFGEGNDSVDSALSEILSDDDLKDDAPKSGKKAKIPPPSPKAKKARKPINPIADAVEIQRIDTVIVPDSERGEIIEVRDENTTKTSYFSINEQTNELKPVHELTKKHRTQLVRIYFDSLRTNILENESLLSGKRIEPDKTTETYWEFNREQIIKHIPVSMQFHLLKQNKIENLYELRLAQKKDDEADILKEKISNEQTELKAIGRIRTLQLVRVYKSPEISKYAPMKETDWDENRATRLMSQLEQAFFTLRKDNSESVEFFKTSASTWSYGVYRILSANLGLLGNLAPQLQDFVAYKEQFKYPSKESGLKRAYKAIYCFTDANNENTIYSFYPPKVLDDKFKEELLLANQDSSETLGLFDNEVNINDAVHANAVQGSTAIEAGTTIIAKSVERSFDLDDSVESLDKGESIELNEDEIPTSTDTSIDEFAMGEPNMGEPDMGEPDMGEPDMGEPDMGEPDMGEPDMGDPDMGEPDMGEPPNS